MLDKNFRDELDKKHAEEKKSVPDGGIPYPQSNRYATLMKQKHIQVISDLVMTESFVLLYSDFLYDLIRKYSSSFQESLHH